MMGIHESLENARKSRQKGFRGNSDRMNMSKSLKR
jgi:hypothetical protein